MSRAPEADAPLRGVRILLTRSHRDNAPLRAELAAHGASVLELPMVATAPPQRWDPVDIALRRLDEYDWLAFTSRTSVEAFFDRCAWLGVSPVRLPRIAVVGPQTARSVEGHGAVVAVQANGTADSLGAVLTDSGIEDRRVLLPVGQLARPELAASLRRAGAAVDQIEVYRTVRPDASPESLAAVRAGEVDAVVFCSPSAVQHLTDMLGESAGALGRLLNFAIGPTTADELRRGGLRPTGVAEPHTSAGLLAAILDYFVREHTGV